MALSIVVSIPDLAQIYMEHMAHETASSNLYMPLGSHTHHNAARSAPYHYQTLISLKAHLSSAIV